MSEQLKQLRDRIDAIDAEMLTLLNRRADLAREIGQVKGGGVVYRPEREAQVLARVQQENPGPLSGETVARLFREIMSACLALERPLSVAYLGPQGTFSQAAAVKHFGHAAATRGCVSIDDVFREVESAAVDYAVVPVENSTEGAVGRTLDLMVNTPLKICGEVVLRVHQFLLRQRPGMEGIRRVVSHSQSLAQCHEWLNQNLPGVERTPVASNAEAARQAAADADCVAIAGEVAGELYGLETLARNIEDEPDNTTRFLVLGRHDVAPSGRDKTSLLLSAANMPGAVYRLLAPLADNGVSMTKLESRPSRTGLWEYVFFLDVEGHRDEEKVARVLDELGRRAAFLKVLGSYPAAVI